MLLWLWLLALNSALAGRPAPLTVLSGHLNHAPAGDTVRVELGTQHWQAVLGPGGDFRMELPGLQLPTPVSLAYAQQRTRLYLTPGDHLRLTLDFHDFDQSLRYSGRGANVNNYLAQALYKFEYGPAGDVPRPLDQFFHDTAPTEMRRRADAFRQQQLLFLATYAAAHPLPAAFRHDAEFGINLQWGTQLLDYVSYHRGHEEAGGAVSAAYFDFLAQVPMKELDQHFGRNIDENSAVALFISLYPNRLAPAGKLSSDPTEGPRLYRLATAELGEGRNRDNTIYTLVFRTLGTDLPSLLAFYPTFRLHNRDSTLARQLRATIAKRLVLGVGRPAPVFSLLDNTGKQVSLSDFRGKVVYLDFWGTWCGPCMREMQESAPALKKKFAGRDVVFVYISVGDAAAKWQQTLASQQFLGPNSVHLRSSTNEVAADYQVNGYPSYYLIDRAGRFIQLYASRPSDGDKTVAAIEQALAR